MGTELYRGEFGTIRHDPERNVLELDWFESTASMSDNDFKEWLERYAEFGEANRPSFLLIDGRQFRHRPGAAVASWREEHIIPRYNAAGVRKLAFPFPSEAIPEGDPAPEGAAAFPTGYFATREQVNDWFGE